MVWLWSGRRGSNPHHQLGRLAGSSAGVAEQRIYRNIDYRCGSCGALRPPVGWQDVGKIVARSGGGGRLPSWPVAATVCVRVTTVLNPQRG